MTNYSWYYHEPAAGAYHAIERHADGPRRTYRVTFCLDPATGNPRSYTGFLPNLQTAKAVLLHLAPDAEQLDGLPAFLR